MRYTPEEFRGCSRHGGRYDPPERTREIAGTLGEVRGEISRAMTTIQFGFIMASTSPAATAKLPDSSAAKQCLTRRRYENLGTTRELIRMPTMGYIHIRLGRDKDERFDQESSFIAEIDTVPESQRACEFREAHTLTLATRSAR